MKCKSCYTYIVRILKDDNLEIILNESLKYLQIEYKYKTQMSKKYE